MSRSWGPEAPTGSTATWPTVPTQPRWQSAYCTDDTDDAHPPSLQLIGQQLRCIQHTLENFHWSQEQGVRVARREQSELRAQVHQCCSHLAQARDAIRTHTKQLNELVGKVNRLADAVTILARPSAGPPLGSAKPSKRAKKAKQQRTKQLRKLRKKLARSSRQQSVGPTLLDTPMPAFSSEEEVQVEYGDEDEPPAEWPVWRPERARGREIGVHKVSNPCRPPQPYRPPSTWVEAHRHTTESISQFED